MKKHFLILLISLLFLLSCAANYYFYTNSIKNEQECIVAIEAAYATIKKKEFEVTVLSSTLACLAEEYTNLYEAYSKCCEPKTPL